MKFVSPKLLDVGAVSVGPSLTYFKRPGGRSEGGWDEPEHRVLRNGRDGRVVARLRVAREDRSVERPVLPLLQPLHYGDGLWMEVAELGFVRLLDRVRLLVPNASRIAVR